MINDFLIYTKLRYTMNVNKFLVSLRRLPIIGKHIPYSIVQIGVIKLLGAIYSMFKTALIYMFVIGPLSALAYIMPYVYSTDTLYRFNGTKAEYFFMSLLIYTIVGNGLKINEMFNYSDEKYVCVTSLRMNIKSIMIMEFLFRLTIDGFFNIIILSILNLAFFKASFWFIPLYTLLFISCRLIKLRIDYLLATHNKKSDLADNIISVFGFFSPALLVLTPVGIDFKTFAGLCFVLTIAGIYCLIIIPKYTDYNLLYKYSVNYQRYLARNSSDKKFLNKTDAKKTNAKLITLDTKTDSDKTGYAYLHDLFVKRHKKLIEKQSALRNLITLVVCGIVIYDQLRFKAISKAGYNPSTILRIMPILMYSINPGLKLTTVMFSNCDIAMLRYNFFRSKSTILTLFKLRLDTILKSCLPSSIMIASTMCIISLLTGIHNEPLTLMANALAVLSLSIFFSVFWLSNYYIFQPYDESLSEKNIMVYKILKYAVYFTSYMIFTIDYLDRLSPFGISLVYTAISLIYVVFALILVKKKAPTNFKV